MLHSCSAHGRPLELPGFVSGTWRRPERVAWRFVEIWYKREMTNPVSIMHKDDQGATHQY